VCAVYIVKLSPNLLEVNARIRASAAMPQGTGARAPTDVVAASGAGAAPLSGTLHNGYNQATASIAPGTSGTITVTFQIMVLSISAATFGGYRARLQEIVSAGTEQEVSRAAGISALPPPDPSSRMASYALQLFSDVVFDGQAVSDQSQAFSDADCATSACLKMLAATRLLDVTQVSFSGTLTASSESPATAQVAAYVPITAIEFADGLTIPFAGYSDNVLVDDGGLTPLDIPREFWSAVAGDGGLGVS